jgi:hypothetical protein
MRSIQITKGAPASAGHDDMVMATALALWGAKLKPVPSFYQVRKTMVDDYLKGRRAARIIRNGGYHKHIRGWNK